MLVSVEKPGSPAEVLEHVGVKGMHWGVRKNKTTSTKNIVKPAMSKKKRVAIGVAGAALVVGGAAYTAFIIKQSGKIPVSSITPNKKDTAAVADFLSKTNIPASEVSEAAKYAEMFLKDVRR